MLYNNLNDMSIINAIVLFGAPGRVQGYQQNHEKHFLLFII